MSSCPLPSQNGPIPEDLGFASKIYLKVFFFSLSCLKCGMKYCFVVLNLACSNSGLYLVQTVALMSKRGSSPGCLGFEPLKYIGHIEIFFFTSTCPSYIKLAWQAVPEVMQTQNFYNTYSFNSDTLNSDERLRAILALLF